MDHEAASEEQLLARIRKRKAKGKSLEEQLLTAVSEGDKDMVVFLFQCYDETKANKEFVEKAKELPDGDNILHFAAANDHAFVADIVLSTFGFDTLEKLLIEKNQNVYADVCIPSYLSFYLSIFHCQRL
jgi:ABC-type branched-subunit amino acid transport system substrate-binding protein